MKRQRINIIRNIECKNVFNENNDENNVIPIKQKYKNSIILDLNSDQNGFWEHKLRKL